VRRKILSVVLLIAALSPLTVSADELPPEAFIEGVTGLPQEHNLSCESRSSTDLSTFWGVPFTEDDFFRRLPKSDNPNRGFLGDVDLPPGSMPPLGYGVYAGPIAATLRSFGLEARAQHAWDIHSLKAEIAAGRPVIVWATYDMQLPGVQTWQSSDGETSIIAQWQHTFLAVGYDQSGVYLIDAYDALTKHFAYESFGLGWDQLGRQAVTVTGVVTHPAGRAWHLDADGQITVDGRWQTGME